ncbi:MAG: hypothetical protein QOI86_1395 [Actinomycetota bacterium]|nr:hypothetical protein [Actinomycetota bacterium]
MELADRDFISSLKIIDSDAHVTEPLDLWTSRLPTKWKDAGPTVFRDDRGIERWRLGDVALTPTALFDVAGWPEYPPSHPPSLEEADPGGWDPKVRLARMDEYGIYSQVLYPNILGFSSHAFIRLQSRDLQLACVRAYNEFIVEFASAERNRLVPIGFLPFWDLDAALDELRWCKEAGIPGVVFGADFSAVDLPPISDDHWKPVLGLAEESDISINFHVGFAEIDDAKSDSMLSKRTKASRAANARMFLGTSAHIADITVNGVCHNFPRLRFVTVESGFGWIPYFVEALDWQWKSSGADLDYPDRLLPSEYFARQVYGSFWFERGTLALLNGFADNIMFETDYPHATSLTPGPASVSPLPSQVAADALVGMDKGVVSKVLSTNAASLYGVELGD